MLLLLLLRIKKIDLEVDLLVLHMSVKIVCFETFPATQVILSSLILC